MIHHFISSTKPTACPLDTIELDDDPLSDEVAADSAYRTLLVTALAGALTAATVLIGWGLQISTAESHRWQADHQDRSTLQRTLTNLSYFQALNVYNSDTNTDHFAALQELATLPAAPQSDRQWGARQSASLQASAYAQKRAQLDRILQNITELSQSQGDAPAQDVHDFQRQAQRRALLTAAEKLRAELRALQTPILLDETTLISKGIAVSDTKSLARDSHRPRTKAAAHPNEPTIHPAPLSASTPTDTATVHCQKLLAYLETNRLNTIADLAIVDDTDPWQY